MKTKILVLAMCTTIFAACSSKKSDTESNQISSVTTDSIKTTVDVPYEVAQNYFLKNTIENKALTLKLVTEDAFNKYFGTAAIMGKNGTPTKIDFSKQYVIAVAGEQTDKETTLTPQSLLQKEGVITFTYIFKEGKKQSFTIRPTLLIIVDNSYTGDVNFEKQ